MRKRIPNIEILPDFDPTQFLLGKAVETEPKLPIKGFFIKWFNEITTIRTNTGNVLNTNIEGIEPVYFCKTENIKQVKTLIEQEDGRVVAIPYNRVKFIRDEQTNN